MSFPADSGASLHRASRSQALLHALRVFGLLIAIDLRQGLRKHLAVRSRRDVLLRVIGLAFFLTFLVSLHLGAYAVLIYTAGSPSRDLPALLAGLGTAVWSFLLFVMISGGLVRALVVLHEQDDSSLLLASPVSPRAVLAGRLLGNALQSCLVDGFIIVPWIDIRVLFGDGTGHAGWAYLWGYPVWFALAVIVTSLDALFSFGLIRAFGLRRARMLAQVVPFLLIFGVTLFAGAVSVTVSQMGASGDHMSPEMQDAFIRLARTPPAAVARAAAGQETDLALIFALAVALGLGTLRVTERPFVEGTQNLAENEPAARPGTADGPFRGGVLVLEVRKGLRLIVRTPMMMVQCLAQALMPVGVACVLGLDDVGRAVAFFVIFAAGVLSGMFTIAAGTVEECEDLLAMAPRPVRLFRYGKMLSGLLWPVTGAAVVGVILLLAGKADDAAAVILGGVPLAVACSLCGEAFATPVKPGVKPKLLADPVMMIPLLGMQIVSGAVAGATVFGAAFSPEALALCLLGSYALMVLGVGLAQLRKPLF
ncbi:MAG: hypothetical protein WDO13_02520 [Verrucomicrobiota bacterium]